MCIFWFNDFTGCNCGVSFICFSVGMLKFHQFYEDTYFIDFFLKLPLKGSLILLLVLIFSQGFCGLCFGMSFFLFEFVSKILK